MLSIAYFLFCLSGISLPMSNFRFGQPIKVNWAYASGQREDTSGFDLLSSALNASFYVFNADMLENVGLMIFI